MSAQYLTETRHIDSEGTRMKVLILRPLRETKPGPGLIWYHGGGYITGMASMVHFSRARDLTETYGITVISPEYRLAGEAPYPAALLDCHNTLLWVREHAEELNILPDRIMVGGESAGGGLAISTALYARDHHTVKIAYLFALYPMIDCYDTPSSSRNHLPVWNTAKNHFAWKAYLKNCDPAHIPVYASPSRETDLSGMPPLYTFFSDIEPFHDEALAFVHAMRACGSEAEYDLYPGNVHAFDMLLPFLSASKKARKTFIQKFGYAMERCARQSVR